jgi:signal peptidase I
LAAEETKRNEEESASFKKSVILYLHDLIYLLAIVMIVFVFLFRIVIVSGSSMYATLQDGDWLLVTGSAFYNDPKYGDIIVAGKDSFNSGEPIIKRVIATQGQTVDIDFETSTVYVDGVALDEPYINEPTRDREDFYAPVTVPEGYVFVMGDNRNHSTDSRDNRVGLIREEYILGKALFRMLPFGQFKIG